MKNPFQNKSKLLLFFILAVIIACSKNYEILSSKSGDHPKKKEFRLSQMSDECPTSEQTLVLSRDFNYEICPGDANSPSAGSGGYSYTRTTKMILLDCERNKIGEGDPVTETIYAAECYVAIPAPELEQPTYQYFPFPWNYHIYSNLFELQNLEFYSKSYFLSNPDKLTILRDNWDLTTQVLSTADSDGLNSARPDGYMRVFAALLGTINQHSLGSTLTNSIGSNLPTNTFNTNLKILYLSHPYVPIADPNNPTALNITDAADYYINEVMALRL